PLWLPPLTSVAADPPRLVRTVAALPATPQVGLHPLIRVIAVLRHAGLRVVPGLLEHGLAQSAQGSTGDHMHPPGLHVVAAGGPGRQFEDMADARRGYRCRQKAPHRATRADRLIYLHDLFSIAKGSLTARIFTRT